MNMHIRLSMVFGFRLALAIVLILCAVTVRSQPHSMPCYVPTNYLVGWWSLDGTASDEGPNALHCLFATCGIGGQVKDWTTDRFGNPTGAGLFDSSYLRYETNIHPDWLTISAWVNIDDPLREQVILSDADNSSYNGSNDGFLLGVVDGKAEAIVYAYGYKKYRLAAGSVQAGVWTHIAMTWRTAHEMILYVNGVAVDSMAADHDGISNAVEYLMIGSASWTEHYPLNLPVRGKISDVGLWKSELSALQIATLYASVDSQYAMPGYVPAAGLVAWYPFTHGAKDESGNGFDGVVNGAQPCYGTGTEGWSRGCLTHNKGHVDCHIPTLPAGNAPRSFSVWAQNPFIQDISDFQYDQFSSWGTLLSYGTFSRHFMDYNYYDILYSGDGFLIEVCNRDEQGINIPLGIPFACYEDTASWPHVYDELQWHLITYTFDGSTERFYFDGALQGSRAAHLSTALTDLHIGYAMYADTQPQDYYDGAIDDIGIWNRPLTDAEVMGLFLQGASSAVVSEPQSRSEIRIFPNPASNTITVSTASGLERGPYVIYDALGRIVLLGELGSDATAISLERLPNGQYTFLTPNAIAQRFMVYRY